MSPRDIVVKGLHIHTNSLLLYAYHSFKSLLYAYHSITFCFFFIFYFFFQNYAFFYLFFFTERIQRRNNSLLTWLCCLDFSGSSPRMMMKMFQHPKRNVRKGGLPFYTLHNCHFGSLTFSSSSKPPLMIPFNN